MFEKFWTMFIVFLIIASVITKVSIGGGPKLIPINQAHAFNGGFSSFSEKN